MTLSLGRRLTHESMWLLGPGLALAMSACAAGRTLPHDAPAEDLPHISWELSAGGVSAMSRVCTSRSPETPCVLRASATSAQQTATLTIDFHAAAQPVSYTGTIATNFLQTKPEHAINETPEPGQAVRSLAIVDRVTSAPGQYALGIDLVGNMKGTIQPVRMQIPVTVEPPQVDAPASKP